MRDVSPRLRAERTARARVRTAWRPERTRTASTPCDRNHQRRPPAQSRHAATDQVLHHHRQRGCRPVDGREVLVDTPQRSTAPARTPDPPKRLLPGTQPKVEPHPPLGSTASQPAACNAVACQAPLDAQLVGASRARSSPLSSGPSSAIRSQPFPTVALGSSAQLCQVAESFRHRRSVATKCAGDCSTRCRDSDPEPRW
jgi:hypothetical protein